MILYRCCTHCATEAASDHLDGEHDWHEVPCNWEDCREGHRIAKEVSRW